MKKAIFLTIITLFIITSGTAIADISYTFTPDLPDLRDLDHYEAYYWNIDANTVVDGKSMAQRIIDGESIENATLSFDNIRNWNTDPNMLFVNLFNNHRGSDPYNTVNGNVSYYGDANDGFSDLFDYYGAYFGEHIDLNDYYNLPSTAQDINYSFSNPAELNKLKDYADDGAFAIAIDPDCHYYNDGITLTVLFKEGGGSSGGAPIPEPATMFLFGTGLVAFAGVARKRLNKK